MCNSGATWSPGKRAWFRDFFESVYVWLGGKGGAEKELVLTLLLSLYNKSCYSESRSHSRNTLHTQTNPYETALLYTSRLRPQLRTQGRALLRSTRSRAVTLKADNGKAIATYKHRDLSSWTKPLCIQTQLRCLPVHPVGRAKSRVICRRIGVRGLLSGWLKFSCSLLD